MANFYIWLFIFITAISCLVVFQSPRKKALFSEQELINLGKLDEQRINPNSLIYSFKRIKEEVWLISIPKENRKKYEFKLLDKRFNELVYIINYQKTSFLPENINRYYAYIGELKKRYPVIDKEYKDRIAEYTKILEIFRDRYPANSAYWMSIQQAIDSTRSFE